MSADMSKFREAMKAGQSRFLYESKPRTQFYVVIFACCVTAAIQLFFAYRNRSAIDAAIAIFIWLVFAPTLAWYCFARKGPGK
jgi:hypothetical protein